MFYSHYARRQIAYNGEIISKNEGRLWAGLG